MLKRFFDFFKFIFCFITAIFSGIFSLICFLGCLSDISFIILALPALFLSIYTFRIALNIKRNWSTCDREDNSISHSFANSHSSCSPSFSTYSVKPNRQPVSVSGYNYISKLSSLDKASLSALQQLVFPGTRIGAVKTEFILIACDETIAQANTIIEDCKYLINHTENPDVFYGRYDLLLEKYTDLSRYEPFIVLYGYQPSESLTYYQASKSNLEKKLIDRCYNKALIKADSLKTEKGKKNQFVKAYELLSKYEVFMTPDNRAYLVKKFGRVLDIEPNKPFP